MSETREPAVAGTFYPGDNGTLTRWVDALLDGAGEMSFEGHMSGFVVPHAGYVYSGLTAAYAYKNLQGEKIDTVIILGPSHHVSFHGASAYNGNYYETPLGKVKINNAIVDNLINDNPEIAYNPEVHIKEHSVEVQVPFLQRVLGDFQLVPIVTGDIDSDVLAAALEPYLSDDVIIIASSDLSHYHTYDEAVELDNASVGAITALDMHTLEQCELCGRTAVMTLIKIAADLGWNTALLDYRNSGDISGSEASRYLAERSSARQPKSKISSSLAKQSFAGQAKALLSTSLAESKIPQDTTGDKSRVVGYASIAFYKPYLTHDERVQLLQMARRSIETYLENGTTIQPEVNSTRLTQNQGAFVTLTRDGNLRGCIGTLLPVKPLYEDVRDNAINAAVNDPRFPPVTRSEIDALEIEISALSLPMRIYVNSPDEYLDRIVIGKHGIIMARDMKSGVLLPQVATDYGWDVQTFLEQTCSKAGMERDCWKDSRTKIYKFSAEVFSEAEMAGHAQG